MSKSAASALRLPSSRVQYAPLVQPLAQYNARILRNAERGNLPEALRLARELREKHGSSVKPNVQTYEALAKGFAVHGLADEALRLVEDAKATGVTPDISIWNQVLKAHTNAGLSTLPVQEAMKAEEVESDTSTLGILISQFARQRNLEGALELLSSHLGRPSPSSSSSSPKISAEMLDLSKLPIDTVATLVRLAVQSGELHLALDFLQRYEQVSPRRFAEDVYLGLFSACLKEGNVEVGAMAFERIRNLKLEITEGMIIDSLNLFCRHGRAEECEYLVSTVLPRVLQGMPPQEWHLAPLVTAYTAQGRLEQAIHAFFRPTRSTSRGKARHSYRTFLLGLNSTERIGEALEQYWKMLDRSGSAGMEVTETPVELTNALLHACADNGMLEEEERLYQSLFAGERLQEKSESRPDLETFNILLRSYTGKGEGYSESQAYSNEERAEELLHILKTDFPDLVPTAKTYEILVQLYLKTSPDSPSWELAFDYLEEMKFHDLTPSASVYIGLLTRLLEVQGISGMQDDEDGYDVPPRAAGSGREDGRIDLVLQEMATLGYLGGGGRYERRRNVLSRSMTMALGKERIMDIRSGASQARPKLR